jgi:replication factor C subunit 3/5
MSIAHRLYIDKYVPTSFDNISFNTDIAKKLIACAQNTNIPHMIIKGYEGSGRKTFANLYIQSKYHVDHLYLRHQILDIKNGSKNIDLQMLYSDYHYQIDPSIHGVYDRLIIQVFIKDILQTRPISRIPYHIVIINNADHLTIETQQSLRRTLEKNVANCRFIFIVGQDSTLIESLVSRCVQIRLAAPTTQHVTQVLSKICLGENIKADLRQLEQIAVRSQRNLSKAVNWLQMIQLNQPNVLLENNVIPFEDINIGDQYISDLVIELISTRTPQNILKLRGLLFDLLVQCIEPIKIMKQIFQQILTHLEQTHGSDVKKHQLVQILVKYENTLKHGSKPIYHLEAMCVAIVNMLNNIN